MRPRTNRVNVQLIVARIERRVNVYTECIRDTMRESNVSYQDAKRMINQRTINNILFKQ